MQNYYCEPFVCIVGSYCQHSNNNRSANVVFRWRNYRQRWCNRIPYTWCHWLGSAHLMCARLLGARHILRPA